MTVRREGELESLDRQRQATDEAPQVSGEKLAALNAELTEQLAVRDRANDDLLNLFESADLATLFLDRDLRVRNFTPAAATLYDLVATDVGRALGDVSAAIADPTLPSDARAVLEDGRPRESALIDRNARDWSCRVLPYRTRDGRVDGVVVTCTDVTHALASERLAADRLAHLETIYRHSGVGLAELDGSLRYRRINDTLAAINGLPVEAHLGRTLVEALGTAAAREAEAVARDVLASGKSAVFREIRTATAATAGVVHDFTVGYHPVRTGRSSEPASGVSIVVRDVTSSRRRERCAALERDVARLTTDVGDLGTALERALERLDDVFPSRRATLRWRETDGPDPHEPTERAVRHGGSPGAAALDALADAFEERAGETCAPFWVPALEALEPFSADAHEHGVGTAFVVPLVDAGTRCGTLVLLSSERLGEGAELRGTLERVGRELGACVRRHAVERRERRRARELDGLMRALPDALLRHDRDGRIRFANPAVAALAGCAPDALVERAFAESPLPGPLRDELLARASDVFERAREVSGEFRLDGASGARWFRGRHVPERGEGDAIESVLSIVTDISDRKRVDAALVERGRTVERALEEVGTLYRNLPIGLCVIDAGRRLLRVNDELVVIGGADLAAREFNGRRIDALHPVLAERLEPSLSAVFARGEPLLGHELGGPLGRDGEHRHWLVDLLPLRDEFGGTRAISCTVRDITFRKLAEQRLAARAAVAEVTGTARELEEAVPRLLATLVEVFEAGLCEYWTLEPGADGLTRRAFHATPDLADAIGASQPAEGRVLPLDGNVVGTVWSEAHARRVADLSRSGESDRRELGVEALGLRTALVFPIVLEGRSIGVVTLFARRRLATDADLLESLEQIGRDIGEFERRLRGERALERARAAAELASQSKSDFLANVSHELRSPLTAILGYADILDTRLSDPEDRRSVGIVRNNGQHLLALLNDILDLAKIESGKFAVESEEVALLDVVADVHALMRVRAVERELAFGVAFEGRLPERVVTDPLRVRQVLINLIGNAVKFTDSGGVTLRVRGEPIAGDAGPPRHRLSFDVIDTGIGMTPAQSSRLFEPFTQVDTSSTRRYGGTGLGLAISRRLARLLDGDLSVHSHVGEGTTFTLTFPARLADGATLVSMALPDDDVRDGEDPAEAGVPALDADVLVVDDRPDIRQMLRRFLESAGTRVTAVADGEVALETLTAAARDGSVPDAIVMDMQMPRLDGYETTRRLRAGGFAKPIVALTAAAMKGERERCIEAGCDDYLSKPIDGARLVGTLAALIGGERAAARDGTTTAPAPPSTNGAGEERPRPNGGRVLLVDDNEDARSVTARLLIHAGHDTRVAADGRSALELAETWKPEVVLLDLGLPDIDGHEVAVRLRAAHGDALTLVALSGREPDHDGSEASPFDHHLLKPAKLRVLTGLLASAGRRRGDPPG